jgi:hypothetical protein
MLCIVGTFGSFAHHSVMKRHARQRDPPPVQIKKVKK